MSGRLEDFDKGYDAGYAAAKQDAARAAAPPVERVGVTFTATVREWGDDRSFTVVPGDDFHEYPALGETITVHRNVGVAAPPVEDEKYGAIDNRPWDAVPPPVRGAGLREALDTIEEALHWDDASDKPLWDAALVAMATLRAALRAEEVLDRLDGILNDLDVRSMDDLTEACNDLITYHRRKYALIDSECKP